jgi:hypothetical protein
MSERLRDEKRTAAWRFSRFAMRSNGIGIFKSSEAVFARAIWSVNCGGRVGDSFIVMSVSDSIYNVTQRAEDER